ncbi:hypothetical protein AB3S75_043060 [Citrus x aurantiifolia]
MGKIVLFSMLIIAMLSVMVAAGSGEKKSKGNNVGFGSTFTNAAKGTSGQYFKDGARKTMEENEEDQAASDCDEGKVIHNPHDAIGVTDEGLQLGKERGIEFTDQKTTEENGGEQAYGQGQGQNLEDNIVDGAKNIFKQPVN